MALLSVEDDFIMTCTDCDLAFGDFGAFAAGEVGFFLPPAAGGPLGSLPGPPPPRRRRRAAGEPDAGKSRGNYNCSKCGQPKRGHGAWLLRLRGVVGVVAHTARASACARLRGRQTFARETDNPCSPNAAVCVFRDGLRLEHDKPVRR
jgi:hypothetical protein